MLVIICAENVLIDNYMTDRLALHDSHYFVTNNAVAF